MDQWNLQNAIAFLVRHTESADLSKPMIVHAVRVAHILESWTDDESIVIAGYLHDVIEDTSVTYDDIESEFGLMVAELVDAQTLADDDRNARGITSKYEKMAACGVDALMVGAADITDNWRHYKVYHDAQKWGDEHLGLERKRELFLESAKEYESEVFYKEVAKLL